ncbi:glycosyltransferase [Campylobacter insulaenigrae]|uniref:glycosyltransferase family 2 protein n=1 Tax=Campylobacter insulaenigrae TaxID=260714 RepID=UPI00215270FC|nr:glycosyltransferase family 2 protein [Campylobacter insulaenigrae]MCR6578795.1 glycosyltransferase [Campylobacter insulaenigrae]
MINQTKKVGVVIPIYNVEKYLRECLDSVINQTYKNLEIVLVNDGSTDENSLNIAKEYTLKDERFILFDKENGGQSTARNVGIEYFSGKYKLQSTNTENDLIEFDVENNHYNIYKAYKSSKAFNNNLENFSHPLIDYIIFLDSDDYWELNCIEECVPRMEGVEIVWFDYGFKYEIDKKHYKNKIAIRDSFLKIYQYKFSKTITNIEWLESIDNNDSTFAFVCFGMIDFNFLKNIKLKFLDNIIHEDHHFGILLFLQATNIYIYLEELYKYRITTNTTCHYDEKIQSIPKYLDKYYSIFEDLNLAKKYHMLSSIFINALEIMKFIKQCQDLNLAKKIEKKFFNFLYMYHFSLFEFKKDPLNLITQLKNVRIIFKEHELQHSEFYFFIEHGTGIQRIKTSLEYSIGSVVVNKLKNKNIISALLVIYKALKNMQNENHMDIPYEAYPDYDQIAKIKSYLSYKIGEKIVSESKKNKHKFYILLIFKILLVAIKWRKNKYKMKQNRYCNKLDDINKQQYPIFKEHDLVDIAFNKKIMKSCFINEAYKDKYWNCYIGYSIPLEGIRITFNKNIDKNDIKVYLYDDYRYTLVDKELFFIGKNENEYYLNIAQTIDAKGVNVFVNNDAELINLKIFTRKTLGYVVSAKPDAFGMRLASIMIGMYLARQINFKFAFIWENNIDVDFLNVRQSVKNNDVHYLGNAMENAEYIFAKNFLDNYLIDVKHVTPSWGHNLGFNQRSLNELKYGKSDEVWGWYSTDILPSKWIKNCNEEECLKKLSQIYHSIEFSSRFNKILKDLQLIYEKINVEFVAIHIRGGEVIFSDSRKVPNWCIVKERYFPYELALELALQEISKNNCVIIFGQDLKANRILVDFISAKIQNADMIKCVDDFIENDYTDMERSFFDMNFMSKAKKIYSAKESVFSKVAMMISGEKKLISYHDVFDIKQQYEIIKKNLFCLNLHHLHTAMAYYRLYALSKQLGKSKDEIFDMIVKTLEHDHENDAYRIYIIDYYLEHKQYELANKMLKDIFETRKEQFLKNFFENSCQSFNNEYKKYLLFNDKKFTYIIKIKEKIQKWIK